MSKKVNNPANPPHPGKFISENTILKVAELDILDVIGEEITIKNYKACCPFHEEKTASFSINKIKNTYKCFGCGKAGNSIQFIMEIHKRTFVEAIEFLCEKNGIQVEYENNFDPLKFQAEKDEKKVLIELLQYCHKKYIEALFINDYEAALNYLIQQRGLSLEIIKEWGIGFAPNDSRFITPSLVNNGKLSAAVEASISVTKDGKNNDFYRNGVIIPIQNESGILSGFAIRSLDTSGKFPKYLNPRDSKVYHKNEIWFGLYQAITARAFAQKNSNPFAFIVEGYFDVITCQEAGLLNTVCACGTSITDPQIKKLKKYVNHVVLMLDQDKAGIKSTLKNIDSFLQAGYRVELVELPDGKDPDEYIRQYKDEIPVNEHILSLCQDATMWKASKLYSNAHNEDDKALAIDEIIVMLLCISNESKQAGYIKAIQTKFKLGQLLKTGVKKATELKLAKEKHANDKAIIEGKGIRNEDAGLPDDFAGEISPFLKYGVYAYKGLYYSKGKAGVYPISNFTMKILYHIGSNRDQAHKIISVTNEYGFNVVFSINTDDYITIGGFKKALARKGNFVFKGNDSDLSRLQEFLQETQLDSKAIEILGFNKRYGFYAFANGIVPLHGTSSINFIKSDETGILIINDQAFYLPAFSKMFEEKDEMYLTEKKFIYQLPENEISINEWMQLFAAAYGEKSIAAILFFIGSLYRDVLLSVHKCYPILNCYGQRGSGKGKMVDSLMRMFGEPQDQIMLGGESTGKGFMRKFGQLKNAIVWLDEYKNNLPVKIIENIKNIYDAIGYTVAKMSNDSQTNILSILSACILSGQEMPVQEPALFTRVIMLLFEPGKFNDEQRKAFFKLKKIEEDGLSYLTAQILLFRKIFEQDYQERYDIIFKEFLKEVNDPEIDDRMIMNVSILAAVYVVLKDEINFPFTYKEVKAFLIDNMKYQASILKGNDDVAKWWQVVEQLAHLKLIVEGRDYLIESGFLYIRLRTVHPLYLKELRSRGDNHFLSISTLENYIKTDKSTFVSSEKKKNFEGLYTTCYQVIYDKLGIDLIKNTDGPGYFNNNLNGNSALSNQLQEAEPEELPFG